MKPETKNYLKTIEKRNLKQDYSSDNIKKKKKGIGEESKQNNDYHSGIKVNFNNNYPKTPEVKRRRLKKQNHIAQKTNISKLMVHQNVKKDNLTPERNRIKHIKEITNVGYCLNYNKTPELENKKGIKIFNNKNPSDYYVKMNSKKNFNFNQSENQSTINQKRKIKDSKESTYNDLFERDYKNNSERKIPKMKYFAQKDHIKEFFKEGMGVTENENLAINPTKGNFDELINQISINNKEKSTYTYYE
jgi:hypothetical protein